MPAFLALWQIDQALAHLRTYHHYSRGDWWHRRVNDLLDARLRATRR